MVAMTGGILAETLDDLGRSARTWREPAVVERVVVGLFFTGVKLANGHAGVCYTPVKSIPEAVCCPSSAMAMRLPGKMRGRDALELAADGEGHPAEGPGDRHPQRTEQHLFRAGDAGGWDLRLGVDPVDALALEEGARVVVVAHSGAYLRRLKARGRPFHVLEQDPAALKADELPFFVPCQRAGDIVPQADVLVVTGSTLNESIEGLLEMARKGAEIVVVGPTSSLLPGALFRRGVRVVAGIRMTQPDTLLDLLAEGGSGTHMFGRTAEKIANYNRDPRRRA